MYSLAIHQKLICTFRMLFTCLRQEEEVRRVDLAIKLDTTYRYVSIPQIFQFLLVPELSFVSSTNLQNIENTLLSRSFIVLVRTVRFTKPTLPSREIFSKKTLRSGSKLDSSKRLIPRHLYTANFRD